MKQIYVIPGKMYYNNMPYSEVMMHMKLAGKPMKFKLNTDDVAFVQLLDNDGSIYSSPVLPGEAGLYWDSDKRQYYFNWDNRLGNLTE